jgi:hypothetical protein
MKMSRNLNDGKGLLVTGTLAVRFFCDAGKEVPHR